MNTQINIISDGQTDNNPKPVITHCETIRSLANFKVPNDIIELHLARTIHSNTSGAIEYYQYGKNSYSIGNVRTCAYGSTRFECYVRWTLLEY
jgi:deoxycytidylate deaminase